MATLLITVDFPPSAGGVQTHSYEIANNLAKLGERVIVLAPRQKGDFEFDSKQKYLTIRVKISKIKRFNIIILLFKALFVIKKYNINRIYATSWYPCGVTSMIVSKLFGIPYFVAIHGLDAVIAQKTKIPKAFLILTLKNSKKVIALGSYQRISLLQLGIQEEKINVVPEGVDLEKFNPNIDSSDIIEKYGDGNKIVLTVSRLVKRKGHDMVIKALPDVLKKVPDVRYLIVGTGPEESNLKRMTEDLGLREHVVFTGFVPESDLPKYYNACDVFIMANREINGDIEGFGIVFLEANACCKPVIGGKSGGTMDAIENGKTGFLVNPLNVEEISNALITLLTDSDLSERLGKNGRIRVEERFSYFTIAKEINKIFEN